MAHGEPTRTSVALAKKGRYRQSGSLAVKSQVDCPLQVGAWAKLQLPVLVHVLTTGGRTGRRRKEERMIALYFRCDESCNLPDMRGASLIFVNVHVKGARNRHLLGQQRNKLGVIGCEVSGQHA